MLVYALTAPNCAAAVALWLADIETTNFRFHATIVVVVCTSRLSQNNCFRIRLPYAKRYFQLDSIHAYRQRQTDRLTDAETGRLVGNQRWLAISEVVELMVQKTKVTSI